jgi:hypothetical protein
MHVARWLSCVACMLRRISFIELCGDASYGGTMVACALQSTRIAAAQVLPQLWGASGLRCSLKIILCRCARALHVINGEYSRQTANVTGVGDRPMLTNLLALCC